MAEKILETTIAAISTIAAALLIIAWDVLLLNMPIVNAVIIQAIFFVVFAIIITVVVFVFTELNSYIKVAIAGFFFPFLFDAGVAVNHYFGISTIAGTLDNLLSDMFVALQSSVQGLIFSLVIFALIKFMLRGR
jgi:hypothetical protein